ncbi:hypothetical protein F511_17179 [Dorcoceras hygrometricum]|uniref:Uncharacterized protein n=2 Tax=Dorcoceras hygrometricum TaxID=472368 RepID=A0A2Z7CU18_9LAMI|nr:hypothetical protein F511_17179 [Dorcoceras hygrometricum]
MSLFDLQDVRIAIGSIATLDLPMVVDLIGIYGLKGPYCTLTTTDWFLQALSVIPRGSWGDVARRFTMIRWAGPELLFRSHNGCGPTARCIPEPLRVTQVLDPRFPHGYSAQWAKPPPPSLNSRRRRHRPHAAAPDLRRKFVSGQFDEENPFVLISSALLVQPDEGVSVLVVDRIGDYLPQSTEKSRVLVIPVGARHKCQQETSTDKTSSTNKQIQPADAKKPAAEISNNANQNDVVEHYLRLVLNQKLDNQMTGLNITGNSKSWYQPQHIKRSDATNQNGVAQLTPPNLVDNSCAIPAASYSSAAPAASYSSAQISRSWTTSRNIQTTMFPSHATVMLTHVDICFD